MNKHPTESWYRLGHRRAVNGEKAVRIWHIPCGRCNQVLEITPGNSTDEGVRKGLLKKGWYIGHRINQHCCPDCRVPKPAAQVAAAKAEPVIAAPAVVEDRSFLMECWETCTEEERRIFARNNANEIESLLNVIPNPLPWYAGIDGSYIAYWESHGLIFNADPKAMVSNITNAYRKLAAQNSELLEQLKIRHPEIVKLIERKQSLEDHWSRADTNERQAFGIKLYNAMQKAKEQLQKQNGLDVFELIKQGFVRSREHLNRVRERDFPLPTRIGKKDVWDKAEVEVWVAKQQSIKTEIDKYRYGQHRNDEIVPNWDDDDIAELSKRIG